MAKIPRINQGEKPSAVPGDAPPSLAGIVAPIAGVADLMGDLSGIYSEEERREALKARAILEAKAKITNEVEAGRRTGELEESFYSIGEAVMEANHDTPEKAPDEFIRQAREAFDRAMADENLKAPVALALAQRGNARLEAAVHDIHRRATKRQTEKAQGDLSRIESTVIAGARFAGSLEDLDYYIKARETELQRSFDGVYGTEAAAKMAAMREQMAVSWVTTARERDPWATLTALEAETGPLVENIRDADKRAALMASTRTAAENFGKIGLMHSLQDAVSKGDKLASALVAGSLDAATISATQRRLDEKERVVKFDPKLSVPQKRVQLDVIAQERAIADAVETAYLKQRMFDATDDTGTVRDLLRQRSALFKKGQKSEDLGVLLAYQQQLANAYGDGRLTFGTFNTMQTEVSLQVSKLVERGLGDPTSVWLPWTWRADGPRKAGEAALERRFAADGRNLPDERKAGIRLALIRELTQRVESGIDLSDREAGEIAMTIYAVEAGRPVPSRRSR